MTDATIITCTTWPEGDHVHQFVHMRSGQVVTHYLCLVCATCSAAEMVLVAALMPSTAVPRAAGAGLTLVIAFNEVIFAFYRYKHCDMTPTSEPVNLFLQPHGSRCHPLALPGTPNTLNGVGVVHHMCALWNNIKRTVGAGRSWPAASK